MMRLVTIAIAAAVLLPFHAHAAVPNMKEGLWEITVRTEMQGMPGGMPPQTVQQCITQKELTDPSKTTPGTQGDKRCKMTDYKMQGNTASWKTACEGDMIGSGTITYAGSSYSGTQTVSMKHDGKTLNMTTNFTGRHLGACKK
jgi:hypothetical protein